VSRCLFSPEGSRARCALTVAASRDMGLAYLMGTIESIVRDRIEVIPGAFWPVIIPAFADHGGSRGSVRRASPGTVSGLH
jgi:hypothetical protein